MTIQWFPGHMAKAQRLMEEHLKLVDVIIELADARLAKSSFNPMLAQIGAHKKRVVIFSKSDLADPVVSLQWQQYYKQQDVLCAFVNLLKPNSKNEIISLIELAGADKRQRDRLKGIKKRPIKAMVVGIPNIGKSTLINRLAPKKLAKTANKPGITRHLTWAHVSEDIILLDTPGVLWPKFEDQTIGAKLALTNAIKEEIIPLDTVVLEGFNYLKLHYELVLRSYYKMDQHHLENFETFINQLAINYHLISKDGQYDMLRSKLRFFKDVKAHVIGRYSWEMATNESL